MREHFDILYRRIARRRAVGVGGRVGMRGLTRDAREPTISTSRASRCATRVRDAEILEAVRAGHRACVASGPSSETIALHRRHLTEPLHCVYRRTVTPRDRHHKLRGDAALFSAPPPPICRGDTITTTSHHAFTADTAPPPPLVSVGESPKGPRRTPRRGTASMLGETRAHTPNTHPTPIFASVWTDIMG